MVCKSVVVFTCYRAKSSIPSARERTPTKAATPITKPEIDIKVCAGLDRRVSNAVRAMEERILMVNQ